jgi:chemotaxis protein methyltransferase CheR
MTDGEYRMFCDLVRKHCGLHFDADSRFLFEKRVARRVEELELGSFAAYRYQLRQGPAGDQEMSRLIDALTTNETYFFREQNQLRTLVQEVIPELLTRRSADHCRRGVSVWSAGCSSGEEPYSVVMMAMEAGLTPGKDLRVYASDISQTMLRKSREGLYRGASFRETEPRLRDKYFEKKDGHYRICEEVKRHVDFIHLNLLEQSRIALLGPIDVILCRNVIIYFDAERKSRVIQTFHDKLRPGGYLLLGHSESLINISSAFELRHMKHDLVYRRPIAGEEKHDPWHALASSAIESSSDRSLESEGSR